MKEDFLHFIWKHRLFDVSRLETTTNEKVVVHQVGIHNHTSGPDFSEARLSLDDTLWAGAVEIHLKSSDWNAHQHQQDPAYNIVVLHVVFEHDQEIQTEDGRTLPTLELRGRIKASLLTQYERLLQNKNKIPCEAHLPTVPSLPWNAWMDRLLVHRLERKSRDVRLVLDSVRGDWTQCFATMIAAYLGGPWNMLPMMEVARRVPVTLLARYRDAPLQREALLLGVAGLLDANEKSKPFRREFIHLQKVHQLQQVRHPWKTGRLRPHQMPVHRIVQYSGMSVYFESVFNELLHQGAVDWCRVILDRSKFWKEHVTFNDRRASPGAISKDIQLRLAINVHTPILFAYAESTGSEAHKSMAIEALTRLAPESNTVIKMWTKHERKPLHAGDSQAMIELKSQFCDLKKCVNCSIGKRIIQGV